MESIKRDRDMKLVTIEKGRNYLVSKPNYNTENFFSANVIAIEMKKKHKHS